MSYEILKQVERMCLENEIYRRCNVEEAFIDFGYMATPVISETFQSIELRMSRNKEFCKNLIQICLDFYEEVGLQSLCEVKGSNYLSLVIKDSLEFRDKIKSLIHREDHAPLDEYFSKYDCDSTMIFISYLAIDQ